MPAALYHPRPVGARWGRGARAERGDPGGAAPWWAGALVDPAPRPWSLIPFPPIGCLRGPSAEFAEPRSHMVPPGTRAAGGVERRPLGIVGDPVEIRPPAEQARIGKRSGVRHATVLIDAWLPGASRHFSPHDAGPDSNAEGGGKRVGVLRLRHPVRAPRSAPWALPWCGLSVNLRT